MLVNFSDFIPLESGHWLEVGLEAVCKREFVHVAMQELWGSGWNAPKSIIDFPNQRRPIGRQRQKVFHNDFP